jgi:hypothetical protein
MRDIVPHRRSKPAAEGYSRSIEASGSGSSGRVWTCSAALMLGEGQAG